MGVITNCRRCGKYRDCELVTYNEAGFFASKIVKKAVCKKCKKEVKRWII